MIVVIPPFFTLTLSRNVPEQAGDGGAEGGEDLSCF